MAEAKRKIKVKWIIVAVALLLVGVVLAIVFVNLFTKKDTREVSGALHSSVQTGFLSWDSTDLDQPLFLQYLDKMQNCDQFSANAQDVQEKIASYKSTYASFVVVARFLDRHFAYTAYTTFYKNTRKATLGALSAASSSAASINTYLDALPPIDQNAFWQAQTWDDLCPMYQNFFQQTANALNLLGQIYTSCVTSPLKNNNFSRIIFVQIEDFSQALKDQQANFMLDHQQLSTFVNAYLLDDTDIVRYQFDTALQAKVDNILQNRQNAGADYNNFVKGILV